MGSIDDLDYFVTLPRAEEEDELFQNTAEVTRLESDEYGKNGECMQAIREFKELLEEEKAMLLEQRQEVKVQRTVIAEMHDRTRIEKHLRLTFEKYLILTFIGGMLMQSCLSFIWRCF